MSATLIVRHTVADYAAWRKVYDSAGALHAMHGCKAQPVLRAPDNPNDLVIIHTFPSAADAQAFLAEPALKETMAKAGIVGQPRVELLVSA